MKLQTECPFVVLPTVTNPTSFLPSSKITVAIGCPETGSIIYVPTAVSQLVGERESILKLDGPDIWIS
jgi:hypothetical protein